MSTKEIAELRREYQALLRRLETNHLDFRRLSRSAFRLQEEERRRIARELHDGIGQNLTALKHLLGLLGDALPSDEAAPRALLERAITVCSDTLEDTRQMARLLRPQVLDDLGLGDALRWLCRGLTESTRLDVSLQLDDEPELEEDVQTVVFRIAQEATTNCVRHAGARRLRISLRERAQMVWLEIADDGRGLEGDGAEAGGTGLASMRERCHGFGGRLQLLQSEWGGLLVRAILPIEGPPVAAADR